MSMSDELKARKLILRCFQDGFAAPHAASLVEEKFHIRGYAARTCQRWFKKFRDGDFDLTKKPKHEPRKKPSTRGKMNQREVKVERVTYQAENRPQESRTRSSAGSNDVVQKLMQRNQITVSKVKPGTIRVKEPSKLMPKRSSRTSSNDSAASKPKEGTIRVKPPSKLMSKRVSLPLNSKQSAPLVNTTKQQQRPPAAINQRRTAGPELQQRRPLSSNETTSRTQTRQRTSINTELRLPPSIAKRMTSNHISTENHTISEATKSTQKTSEPAKKSITVQFQNVSPEVAKNTVRKSTESGQSSTNSSNKKPSAQSSNSLSSPKGVIYLNPQEIFGETINLKNAQKKTPAPVTPAAKPPNGVAKPTPAPAAKPAQPSVVTVDDSDSEDDLVFPENVSLPPPKVKAVVNTFTTYWDMETDKPILLNPTDEVISTLPVIELE